VPKGLGNLSNLIYSSYSQKGLPSAAPAGAVSLSSHAEDLLGFLLVGCKRDSAWNGRHVQWHPGS
jgi:hypothetical protein